MRMSQKCQGIRFENLPYLLKRFEGKWLDNRCFLFLL